MFNFNYFVLASIVFFLFLVFMIYYVKTRGKPAWITKGRFLFFACVSLTLLFGYGLTSLILLIQAEAEARVKNADERQTTIAELKEAFEKERVKKLWRVPKDEDTFQLDVEYTDSDKEQYLILPKGISDKFVALAYEKDVPIAGKWRSPPSRGWSGLIGTTFIMVVAIVVMLLGLKYLGLIPDNAKFKKEMLQPIESDLSFVDVGGVPFAKKTVEEIVDYLRDPKRYVRLSARPPRGVLFKGPPGTGKTLLAKAIAGEAGVPVYSINASDFVEVFVGVGASRVRELFKQARKHPASIIFIDEIDALGASRATGGHGNDERIQTLLALIAEMDGMKTGSGVFVIGATNNSEILDPALLRPGRFDRSVDFYLPNYEERQDILIATIASRDLPVSDEVSENIPLIAQFTEGFSGAALANLLNEAALIATRKDAATVDLRHIETARDRIIEGEEGTITLIGDVRRATAYHEAGHAVLAYLFPDPSSFYKASIMANRRSFGRVIRLPLAGQPWIDRKKLIQEIAMILGGSIGEELNGKDPSTGRSDDFNKANNIARRMVGELGYGSTTKSLVCQTTPSSSLGEGEIKMHPLSDEALKNYWDDVSKILKEAEDLARKTLEENKDFFKAVAEGLERNDVMTLLDLQSLDPKERGENAATAL